MHKRTVLIIFVFILKLINSIDNVAFKKCSKNKACVRTISGWLEGKIVENSGSDYQFYKGIPYAEPPVGKLRFQAPVPKSKWDGIRLALEHGNFCATRWGLFGMPGSEGGSEDCLFLNVYTPSLQGKRSVIFFIHGGSFTSGNGDTSLYGPDHLIKEDVVLVTVNYRLSAFGFLSSNDEHAPGNQGLKDIMLALKWVKRNIRKFGGNPEDVTISGQSAGSAAVHYLIISDIKENLFHKAIMQSGTSLMPPLFQPDPKTQAETLGRRLNKTFSSTKDLIEKLQAVDFQEIMSIESSVFDMPTPVGLRPYEFAPCVEPKNTKNAFLTEKPIKRMIEGKFKKIPLLLGGTNFEAMYIASHLSLDSSALAFYNSNPNFIVPMSFELNEGSEKFKNAEEELQKIYFNGHVAGGALDWSTIYSDAVFLVPSDRVARFCAAIKHPPIYYYQFAFDGSLNFYKKALSLQSFPGASHADELFYIFEPDIPGFIPDKKSTLVRNRMTKMWTNFAKYGNPTPRKTSLLPETWKPFTLSEEFYFNIDENLENRQNLPRMNVISDLQKKYTGHF